MRILRNVILLFVFTACFFEMQAQVQYGLSFDRERYLQYEKIQVTFTVVNNSGTRLNFGTNESSGKMKLLVVDPENRLVSSYDNNFNPMNGLVLAAGETKSLVFNVNEHFSMTRQGRYKISASLTHPSLSGWAFETPEKLISINTGTTLKQKNFGVVDMWIVLLFTLGHTI